MKYSSQNILTQWFTQRNCSRSQAIVAYVADECRANQNEPRLTAYTTLFTGICIDKWQCVITNSVIDVCTVNAFITRSISFASTVDLSGVEHQAVKFDFTADLMGTKTGSEEVIK